MSVTAIPACTSAPPNPRGVGPSGPPRRLRAAASPGLTISIQITVAGVAAAEAAAQVLYDVRRLAGRLRSAGVRLDAVVAPAGGDAVPGGVDAVSGGVDAVSGGVDAVPGGVDAVPGGVGTALAGGDAVPGGVGTVRDGGPAAPGTGRDAPPEPPVAPASARTTPEGAGPAHDVPEYETPVRGTGVEPSRGTAAWPAGPRLHLLPIARAALLDDEPVRLTRREFELLLFLCRRRERVFTREQLLTHVWGYEWTGGARTIDVHIRRLRVKLGPAIVSTVHGVGYRIDDRVEVAVAQDPRTFCRSVARGDPGRAGPGERGPSGRAEMLVTPVGGRAATGNPRPTARLRAAPPSE